ncbi:carboxypeptidase-like regulatory domain-containing protein [Blastopirellula marina]|nr:carboxypeptidase-like regulatory domain-containing protein [Blastopirellula marina]
MKKTRGYASSTLLAAVLMLHLTGCSPGGIATYPTSGKVTYTDGSPVTGGLIIFADSEQNISSEGVIESDGSYYMGTYSGDDGVPQGNYQVTIQGFSEYGKQSQIAGKFANRERTPLEAKVEGANSSLDFQVERAR